MKVHVRKRQGKDKSIINLFLEVYRGYSKRADGKTSVNRTRRKLDYFLYAKPKTHIEKAHNKEVNQKVEVLQAETLKDLLNGKYGFVSDTRSKANFIDYFQRLTEKRRDSKGNYGNWDSVLKHLKAFAGESLTFKDIDVAFCEKFKKYLVEEAKTSSGKNFSGSTASSYFCKLRAALNQAVQDEIVTKNPAKMVSIPKVKETKREYLTEEEVKTLYETECRYDVLKRAFLFSCLTGLRWSDIQKLKWSEIRKEGSRWKITFHQQKTDGLQYHIITNKAKELLGKPVNDSDKVFVGLNYSTYMNVALEKWIMKAGITKNITFHCARHTFATLLLTKGNDIYTVSKLLGHKEIRTTQIYANIIDQRKVEAIDTLNILD